MHLPRSVWEYRREHPHPRLRLLLRPAGGAAPHHPVPRLRGSPARAPRARRGAAPRGRLHGASHLDGATVSLGPARPSVAEGFRSLAWGALARRPALRSAMSVCMHVTLAGTVTSQPTGLWQQGCAELMGPWCGGSDVGGADAGGGRAGAGAECRGGRQSGPQGAAPNVGRPPVGTPRRTSGSAPSSLRACRYKTPWHPWHSPFCLIPPAWVPCLSALSSRGCMPANAMHVAQSRAIKARLVSRCHSIYGGFFLGCGCAGGAVHGAVLQAAPVRACLRGGNRAGARRRRGACR